MTAYPCRRRRIAKARVIAFPQRLTLAFVVPDHRIGEMDTTPAPTILTLPTHPGGVDIVHIECCKDRDTALCGRDLTDHEQGHPDDIPCAPCEVAAAADKCPKFGRCIDEYCSWTGN